MILSYLKESKKAAPEVQMRAEGLINAGYQRLLTFEVPGGGFSWFGEAPAHPMLTAYGLMEFRDMQGVFEVDEKIIERTQKWLSGKQKSDGSFERDAREMHSGPQSRGRDELNTAFIAWALLESGYKGEASEKAIEYLKRHIEETDDAYTLALMVNAMGLYNEHDSDLKRALERLIKKATIENDTAYWTSNNTATYGCGESGNVETTALTSLALLRFSGEASLLQKALNYIVASRGASGAWGSTQATVMALRALLESQRMPFKRSGTIVVRINGMPHSNLVITPETADVLQMADLRNEVKFGENHVTLELSGKGSYMYQITGKYYMPWKGEERQAQPGLSIKVHYDRTTMSMDDILKAEAVLECRGEGSNSMVIADLGIPPGFTVLTGDFDELKGRGIISRYEVTSRKVILYLMDLHGRVSIPYRMKARFPLRAKTPSSRVYEYYNPGNEATDRPQSLTVR